MNSIEIIQIPVLTDNYIYLLHNLNNNEAAIVDPAVAKPVIDYIEANNLTLTHILNTHHHHDHIGANIELKEKYNCVIVGCRDDRARIPGIDILRSEGESITFGAEAATIFEVPGHTIGHIAYWFQGLNALFCGDTVFSMGCGRLFEGTPDQMWNSIQKLMTLPDETKIYCAHEYTKANGDFALSLEPNNNDLIVRIGEVKNLRQEGLSTIPTNMALEKNTNPFMRPNSNEIKNTLGMEGAQPTEIFKEIRLRKDNF